MHPVIASREDPPLPLSRLRVRAQMVEIRQAALTFTAGEATAFLRRTMGIELGARSGNVEIQIGGYRILARLRQAQGDASAALDALRRAHQLAREKDVSPLMRARNAACHVQIALAQGDWATAILWAEQVTEEGDCSRFCPRLGLTPARLLLAQDEKAAAAEQLDCWYEAAVGADWQFGVISVCRWCPSSTSGLIRGKRPDRVRDACTAPAQWERSRGTALCSSLCF
jgi:ATP/maltotriose-dependent transcriptional regulator MalT